MTMALYRRTIITLDDLKTRKDYMLFCVFEKLWPDMVSPQPLHKHPKCKDFNGDGRFDVCVHVDEENINTNVADNPLPYVTLKNKVDMLWGDMRRDPDIGVAGFELKKGHADIDSVTDVLPNSDSVQEVWSWFDTQRSMTKFLATHNIDLDKIGKFTKTKLGFDISLHPLQVGCIYVVYYKPIRTVHLETVPTIPAVRCEIRWRDISISEDVTIRVTERIVEKKSNPSVFETQLAKGKTFALVTMNGRPHMIDIEIFNFNGERLYFLNNVTFISGISTRPKPNLQQASLSKEIGLEHYLKPAILDKDRRLQRERMEFVFFDGNPQKKTENKNEAIEYVKRILGKANKKIIIADPYFSDEQFTEYIVPFGNEKLNIIIINCKEQLEQVAHGRKVKVAEVVNKLKDTIAGFNEKNVCQAACYCITGQGRLHDRFVLTEKEGWLIGSSLSEFGNRACSIVKTTESGWQQLWDLANEWCENENVSQPIDKMIWTEKTKSSIMSLLECLRRNICTCFKKK